jgi:hypothetical protein
MTNPWLRRLRWACATAAWTAIVIAAVVAIALLIGDVPPPSRSYPDGSCGNLLSSEWRTDDTCHVRVTRILWFEGSLLFIAAAATAGWIWVWRRD